MQFEIGRRNATAVVSFDCWKAAEGATTYTQMGINLMVGAFHMDTLLKCNVGGGGGEHDPLDPVKLKAIKGLQ